MKYPQGCFVQFAKVPEVGRVKTRLIPAIGEQKAMQLHQALTERTLDTLVTAGLCPVKLWLDEPASEQNFIKMLTDAYPVQIQVQQGIDLGERMANAVKDVLKRYEFVILVGSDCPTLDKAYLKSAIDKLTVSDLVIGPAEDGGYVLIGARQVMPEIFAGIDWGTERVLEQTMAKLKTQSKSAEMLSLQWDVDDQADLKRLADTDPAFERFYPADGSK